MLSEYIATWNYRKPSCCIADFTSSGGIYILEDSVIYNKFAAGTVELSRTVYTTANYFTTGVTFNLPLKVIQRKR